MEIIVWTGFNILLLLLIIYAWIKVFIVLRHQIGIGLAALFLLSLSVFRGNADHSSEPPENLIASNNRPTQFGNWSNHSIISLNSNNKLFFLIEGKREGTVVQPVGLYVTVSGFLLGHEWKPIAGIANAGSKQVSYNVHMQHDWKLLGAKLYTTAEEYKGYMSTTN